MPGAIETDALRRNKLGPQERQKLIEPYLPAPAPKSELKAGSGKTRRNSLTSSRPHLRPYLASFLHKLIFHTIQLAFSIYITLRQIHNALLDRIFSVLYYHHRTPELIQRDIKSLSRIPKHLSIIVDLESTTTTKPKDDTDALLKLIGDVAEISCWCACAGIPMLSIYERTGVLKQHVPTLHRNLIRMMETYFPPSSSQLPSLHIRAPHHPSYSPPSSPSFTEDIDPVSSSNGDGAHASTSARPNLNLLLLSASDGRETLVDLTKTLAEMAQRGKLRPADVTAELIDAEVTESSCGEPDLLVLMAPSTYRGATFRSALGRTRGDSKMGAGERAGARQAVGSAGAGGDVCLRGYPPWQVRLTEIFHVRDSAGVDYQVFLRALHRYAKAEMRLGR